MTWLHALTSPRSRCAPEPASVLLHSVQYSDVTVLLVVCKPSSRFTAPLTADPTCKIISFITFLYSNWTTVNGWCSVALMSRHLSDVSSRLTFYYAYVND